MLRMVVAKVAMQGTWQLVAAAESALPWQSHLQLGMSMSCAGPDTAAQEQEAENKRLFNELTEAAGELLDLGFEDIYQDTRESLAASLGRCSLCPLPCHAQGHCTSQASHQPQYPLLLLCSMFQLLWQFDLSDE